MSVLDTLDFQPILLTDLFTLHNGEGAERKVAGPVPYVAASFQNNGVVGYVEESKYPGGWLSFVKDGDGGAGTCFYQPAPFWPSNHVLALEPKSDAATAEALLVMASLITHQCFPKYNRGNAANARRLSRQYLMVPALIEPDDTIAPDWDGMDRLGAELLDHVLTHTHSARETRLTDDDTLPELRFEPMFITDVFDSMKASKAWYDKSKLCLSGVPVFPFVSRAKASNGVDSFCPRQDKAPEAGNAMTIGLDTQTIGYQPVPFYTSQNIQVLRHERLNESNALVLSSLIQEQMGKFSWGGNGATLGRLKKTHIMVPVVTDGSGEDVVDWESMAAYGRALRVRVERAIDTIFQTRGHYPTP